MVAQSKLASRDNKTPANATSNLSALSLSHHGIEQSSGSQSYGVVSEWLGRNTAHERERHTRGEFGYISIESSD